MLKALPKLFSATDQYVTNKHHTMSASTIHPSGTFASQNGGQQVTTDPSKVHLVLKLEEGVKVLAKSAMAGVCTQAEAFSMVESTLSLGANPRFSLLAPVFPAGGGTQQQQSFSLAEFVYDKACSDKYFATLEECRGYTLAALNELALERCFPTGNHLSLSPHQLIDAITATLRSGNLTEEANRTLLEMLKADIKPSDDLRVHTATHARIHQTLLEGGRALNDGHKYQLLVASLALEDNLVQLLHLSKASVPALQVDDFGVVTTELNRRADLLEMTALRATRVRGSRGEAHAVSVEEEGHEANAATAYSGAFRTTGGRGGRSDNGGRGRGTAARGDGRGRGGRGGRGGATTSTNLSTDQRNQVMQVINNGSLCKYCYRHGFAFNGHTSETCRDPSFPADKRAASASNKMGGSTELNGCVERVAKEVFGY